MTNISVGEIFGYVIAFIQALGLDKPILVVVVVVAAIVGLRQVLNGFRE